MQTHLRDRALEAGNYGPGFARVYRIKWGGFAEQVAPRLQRYYAARSRGLPPILDLCCGTGMLTRHFLDLGYPVTGLDLSAPMLDCARAVAREYIAAGRVRFVHGDASRFCLDQRFGLVVSTYDALNHLPDDDALRSCFECVSAVCDGYFIFDLNTRAGLERWNRTDLDLGDEAVVVTCKSFDPERGLGRARFTCFLRGEDGRYERIDQTVSNTAFALADVAAMLRAAGFDQVRFARFDDLEQTPTEPEAEHRVFVVAAKSVVE